MPLVFQVDKTLVEVRSAIQGVGNTVVGSTLDASDAVDKSADLSFEELSTKILKPPRDTKFDPYQPTFPLDYIQNVVRTVYAEYPELKDMTTTAKGQAAGTAMV